MSAYYEEIRALIDPEQAYIPANGVVVQDVSVIMTQRPGEIAPERRLEAAIVTLGASEAREFAFELLAVAEQAERIGGRR